MSKSSTQLKAYRKHRNRVSERESDVRSLLTKYGEMSRRQMALEIGVESNSVTAAVRNMLNRGELVISGSRYDEKTKCEQDLLKLTGKSVAIPKKVPKSATIASLRLENDELRSKLNTVAAFLKFLTVQDSSVASLAQEFAKAKGA